MQTGYANNNVLDSLNMVDVKNDTKWYKINVGCCHDFSHPPPFSLIASIISSNDIIFSLGFCWLQPWAPPACCFWISWSWPLIPPARCSSWSICFQSENEVGKVPVIVGGGGGGGGRGCQFISMHNQKPSCMFVVVVLGWGLNSWPSFLWAANVP